MFINAPQNLQELVRQCQQMQYKSLGQLANELALKPPSSLNNAKGWIGQLIENYLGASAASRALPDFPHLGIELKTIPVNQKHRPLESTYVCTVQTNATTQNWRESWVYQKLRQVLWVPIQGEKSVPIQDRIVLKPILWQMDHAYEQILKCDWEELMEMMQLGIAKNLTARFGTYLHIRPKAANSKVLIEYTDINGIKTKIVPKGFYLRQAFTENILLDRI